MLHLHLPPVKENKIVALRRRQLLRPFQEIQRNRQSHLRETPYLKAPHAKQEPRCKSLAEKFQCVFLAIHSPGKDENKVCAPRDIRRREPCAKVRPPPRELVRSVQASITIPHRARNSL